MPDPETTPTVGEEPQGEPSLLERVDTSTAIPAEEILPQTMAPEPKEAEPEKPERLRDPQTGQFVSAEPSEAQTPQGETPAPAEAAPAPEAPAEPATEAPEGLASPVGEYEAYNFNADGQAHEIPGSMVGEQGIFIPTDQLPWLQQQLATAVAHHGSWQQQLAGVRRESEQATHRAEAKEKAADLIVDTLTELVGQDEDSVFQWVQDYKTNLPTLLAQAEVERVKAENEALTTAQSTAQEEEQVQQLQTAMDQGLDTLVETYTEQYPGVDPQMMRQRLDMLRSSVFYLADHDDPAGSYQKGEVMVRFDIIENEFQHAATLMGVNQQTAEVVEQNQAALAPSEAPPVAPASGAEPASTEQPMPKFRTQREMEEYMESPEADKWAQERFKRQR